MHPLRLTEIVLKLLSYAVLGQRSKNHESCVAFAFLVRFPVSSMDSPTGKGLQVGEA